MAEASGAEGLAHAGLLLLWQLSRLHIHRAEQHGYERLLLAGLGILFPLLATILQLISVFLIVRVTLNSYAFH